MTAVRAAPFFRPACAGENCIKGYFMANHKSAIKRHRQNLKRNKRNRSQKSEISTLTKRLLNAGKEDAVALFKALQSKIDKASRKNLFHPKTAAKKVGKLQKLMLSK